MSIIYLDHNATTPIDPEVRAEIDDGLDRAFGNPSSIHGIGQEAHRILDLARARVASLISANADEILFTSGGTEANNLAIIGALAAQAWERPRILAASIEHQAVLNPCRRLAQMGAELTLLPVDGEGRIDLAAAEAAMRAGASLASIMLANNEVGTLQPVAELAAEARENQIPFHTDAVQAAGKIPIDVRKLGVDLLSLSAHKLHGPKGVGALFVRKGTKLAPISFGGHQERGLRPGTENVPAIAGFGKACELAAQRLEADARRIAELRDQLERAVLEQVPGATVNAAGAPRLPNTSNVSFEGLDMLAATGDHPAEPLDDARGGLRQPSAGVLDVAPGTPALPASTASLSGRRLPVQSAMSDRGSTRSWLDGGMLAINLDLLGVAVSTGSACGTRASEISHVLLAMGRTEEQARAAVRFSLGRGNTAEEIRRAVELIRQAVLAMRNAR